MWTVAWCCVVALVVLFVFAWTEARSRLRRSFTVTTSTPLWVRPGHVIVIGETRTAVVIAVSSDGRTLTCLDVV